MNAPSAAGLAFGRQTIAERTARRRKARTTMCGKPSRDASQACVVKRKNALSTAQWRRA